MTTLCGRYARSPNADGGGAGAREGHRVATDILVPLLVCVRGKGLASFADWVLTNEFKEIALCIVDLDSSK
jgi:hypothetical protein